MTEEKSYYTVITLTTSRIIVSNAKSKGWFRCFETYEAAHTCLESMNEYDEEIKRYRKWKMTKDEKQTGA